MEVTIDIKMEDYLYFNDFHAFKRRWKQTLITILVIILILVGMDIISSAIRNKQIELSNYTTFIIILIPFYFIFLFLSSRSRANKFIHSSPSLLGTSIIHANVAGIKTTNVTSEGFIKWEGFYEFIETQRYFILYNTSISALILPKRNFKSEKEINEFSSLLKEKAKQLNIKYFIF